MPDALSNLAPELARRLTAATGLAIAVSGPRGRTVARTGPERGFCPLFNRDAARATPLPSRCEDCPRAAAFLAHAAPELVPCPYGVDAVRPIEAGGALVARIATGLLSLRFAGAARRAERIIEAAALPLAAALAADEGRHCRAGAGALGASAAEW
jgi:hypothetical protein